MRIERIKGYDFPVTLFCDTEDCNTTFTVTMPGDMRRVGVWKRSLVDNVPQPQKTGERILAKCPCCNTDHKVPSHRLSPMLTKQIPYDKSGDPIIG